MSALIGSIIVFLLVVLLHEFGHFSVAKLVGIKVNEFSVGMGPKIFQKTKGETKYSL
ncbi:MAG: site-2 protease family protein, partial [Peptoniphilus lacrimalis]